MNEVFASRLKELREESELSQTELADQLGVSRGSISFYENKSRVPDIDVLQNLCKLFSVSSDYLLGLSDLRNNYGTTLVNSFLPEPIENEFSGDRKDILSFVSKFADLYSLASDIDPSLIPYVLNYLSNVVNAVNSMVLSFEENKRYALACTAIHDVANYFRDMSVKEKSLVFSDHPNIEGILNEVYDLASSMPNSPESIAADFSDKALKEIESVRDSMAVFALRLCSKLSQSQEPEE